VRAGEAFGARVSAVSSSGTVTPNFGREVSPQGVALGHALVSPAGGAAGAVSNASITGASFSAGIATVTGLAFNEVGIINLSPNLASGNYLGAGHVTGTASGNVGRFVPARFQLSARSVAQRVQAACSPASSFTYLGENFRLGFALEAQNTAGSTTLNYQGSFAKFDPTSASAFALAGRDGTTVFDAASGRLSLGSSSGAWTNGVANAITLTANVGRATSPDGPFSTAFGIAPTDSDGVTLASFDMASVAGGTFDRATVASVPLRYGRLRLANAVTTPQRSLSLPLSAQVWNGSAFDTHALDSCTRVPATALSFGNLRRTLTAADMGAAFSTVTLVGGTGRVTLLAPSAGHHGSADVVLSLGAAATDASCLQPWTPARAATAGANLGFLRGAWCGTSDKDPAARATWGVYGGSDDKLYMREDY
jgi:MSHA biogenesis protein MshQ